MKKRDMAQLVGTIQTSGIHRTDVSTAATDFPTGREVWLDIYADGRNKISLHMSKESALAFAALCVKAAEEI